MGRLCVLCVAVLLPARLHCSPIWLQSEGMARAPELLRGLLLHSIQASLLLLSSVCLQSEGMVRAQELLRRLRVRDIYKHVGSVDIPHVRRVLVLQVLLLSRCACCACCACSGCVALLLPLLRPFACLPAC